MTTNEMRRRRYYLVRVNRDDHDVYASDMCVGDAIYKAMPDEGDALEWAQVYSTDIGAARVKQPRQWRKYEGMR